MAVVRCRTEHGFGKRLTLANEPVWALVSGLPSPARENRWFMILQACIDDSGSGAQELVLAVAGFASTVEMWVSFADEWQRVLDGPPKLEYFKMSEADSRVKQFAGWSETAVTKRVLDLVEVIKSHVMLRLHCSIMREDYNLLIKGNVNPIIDDPYYMCFWGVILSPISFIQNVSQYHPKMEFIFDEHGAIGHEAARWYAWLKAGCS